MKPDPDRLAVRLVYELKSGNLAHLGDDVIARACDLELARTGKLSAMHRDRFIHQTWRAVRELQKARVRAHTIRKGSSR